MTLPTARPILHIRRPYDDVTAGRTYTMNLRGSPYSITWTSRAAALLELQLLFVCPLGLLEGELRAAETADVAGDDVGAQDWIFPAIFPKGFGLRSGMTYPALPIIVGGDVAFSPVLYFIGPCENPEVYTNIPGERFKLSGITLASGDIVQVDMNTGTVRLSSTSAGTIINDMDVYNSVDWAVSTFWRWQPGPHVIHYPNIHGSIRIEYRERRLTI